MRVLKINKFEPLEVFWEDIVSNPEWNDLESFVSPSRIKTLGFFVKTVKKDGRQSMVLAHSISDDNYGDYTIIPWTTVYRVYHFSGKEEYWGGSFLSLLKKYKAHAEERDLVWSLTNKQFEDLTKQSCYYCGTAPSNIWNGIRGQHGWVFNGVDRVDNTKGYLPENCVPCCKYCNHMKWDVIAKDFLSHCKKIADYQEELYECKQ